MLRDKPKNKTSIVFKFTILNYYRMTADIKCQE